MSPDEASAPHQVILSRELYTQIISVSTLPVLVFLIWLSWVIINRLMSSEWRQKRRSREIRKAVAAREARFGTKISEKTLLQTHIERRYKSDKEAGCQNCNVAASMRS